MKFKPNFFLFTLVFFIANATCSPSIQGEIMKQNEVQLSEAGQNKIRLMNYLQKEV